MRDTSKRIQKTKDEIANALCSLLATEQYDVITIQEIADLEYHLLVLMVDRGITLDDVEAELRSRRS